jgi:hypothetical protein
MKYILIFFFALTLYSAAFAQENEQMVKYEKGYVFQDGIYMTFEEFKLNNPSIKDFKAARNSQFSTQINLEYDCIDPKSGQKMICVAHQCWGYVQNNNVFIAQGPGGFFFRLQIIGALIHYYAIEMHAMPYYDYNYGYPQYRTAKQSTGKEYVIEFQTGKKIEFNFKNFSAFLKEKDIELYDELLKTKRKRKMIYHFLIRYNEKHNIFLPVR